VAAKAWAVAASLRPDLAVTFRSVAKGAHVRLMVDAGVTGSRDAYTLNVRSDDVLATARGRGGMLYAALQWVCEASCMIVVNLSLTSRRSALGLRVRVRVRVTLPRAYGGRGEGVELARHPR
jgi:hypothetical protein